MRGHELLEILENLDPAYIEEAAEAPKAKRSDWRKWSAMAAGLCLLTAGMYFGVRNRSVYQIELTYNEASYVMVGAASADSKAVTAASGAEEVSGYLGYNIEESLPAEMKSYDYKYTTVRNKDTNEVLGIIVTGRKVGEQTSRPGIWIEVSFGDVEPVIDYDYVNKEQVNSVIGEVEVCATVVSERTHINAVGEKRIYPAVYSAAFQQDDRFYFIESRGDLHQKIFDELVCAIVRASDTE